MTYLKSRAKRLSIITQDSPVIADEMLLKVLKVSDYHRSKIESSLNYFLWTCLSAAHPNKNYVLSENLWEEYIEEIHQLPNITPNGKILPRKENILAYNQFQQTISESFSSLNLPKYIEKIAFPPSLRIRKGLPNPKIDQRPRATTKYHSDIWAGESSASIIFLLQIFGDSNHSSSVEFLNPIGIPEEFVRELDDYNEGKFLSEKAETLPVHMDKTGCILMDPFLLHRTTLNGASTRISVDFRFTPIERAEKDNYIGRDSTIKGYIPMEQWSKIGTEILAWTEDSMHKTYQKSKNSSNYHGKMYLIRLKDQKIIDSFSD